MLKIIMLVSEKNVTKINYYYSREYWPGIITASRAVHVR